VLDKLLAEERKKKKNNKNRSKHNIMLFKDKNLSFGAPQTLEFRNFPYAFQWGETGCYKLLNSID
jgi:hypothetical protein